MSVLAAYKPLVKDPALLLTAALMVLFGAHVASLLPQASTIAVTVFGLDDGAYSRILVVASVIAVTTSVGFGIIADQRANRRAIALVSGVFLTLGSGLMTLHPGPVTFVLAHAIFVPLSSTLFGQMFALGRLAASVHPKREREAIQSSLRALFALPWLGVLPIWSLAFGAGVDLMTIYPVCLCLALAVLVLTFFFWPRDGATRWPDPKSGLTFRQSLQEMGDWRILVRVVALGAINGGVVLYLVLIGLVFAQVPGRGAGDVSLYAAITAGLEVPLMLMVPAISMRVPRITLILVGTVLYCVHLAFIPVLASSPLLWVLPVFGALGGAFILTQPMAYLQDLLSSRPGAGASLLALQKLIGDVSGAAVFAIGAAVAGYGFVAMLGSALAILAATALFVMDRRTGGYQGRHST
ncbi:hypothetical protein ABEB22_03890 [Thioclava sp. 'Guangxiensis']|uniref:hypothetical protein n=1 Tax=Thioclava sp. 'Guangxiensis' TaxID=3149044 RepID=UPI0038781E7E